MTAQSNFQANGLVFGGKVNPTPSDSWGAKKHTLPYPSYPLFAQNDERFYRLEAHLNPTPLIFAQYFSKHQRQNSLQYTECGCLIRGRSFESLKNFCSGLTSDFDSRFDCPHKERLATERPNIFSRDPLAPSSGRRDAENHQTSGVHLLGEPGTNKLLNGLFAFCGLFRGRPQQHFNRANLLNHALQFIRVG